MTAPETPVELDALFGPLADRERAVIEREVSDDAARAARWSDLIAVSIEIRDLYLQARDVLVVHGDAPDRTVLWSALWEAAHSYTRKIEDYRDRLARLTGEAGPR